VLFRSMSAASSAPPMAGPPMAGRFYEAEYPDLNEIVVVQVRRVVDMGAYATLLEYNGKEGMMLLNELSKRRVSSFSKLLRVGRTEICTVLKVDKEKGYIDLSKCRVEPEKAEGKRQAFAKAKAVHSIMCHVAAINNIEVEELCKKVSWPLFKKHQDARDAYEALKRHINGEIALWPEFDFRQPGKDLSGIASKLKADIEATLRRRMAQQMLKLKAKAEVSCPEYSGIDAVREALNRGFEASRQGCELNITLIAHPIFVITSTCQDRDAGVAILDEAIELIDRWARSRRECTSMWSR